MELQDLQQVDRATWRRYLFYLDLVVIAIFCVSLILAVRHTFIAGQYFAESHFFPERGVWGLHTETMWALVADTVFLVASLMWILYRFFRNEYVVMTRRF